MQRIQFVIPCNKQVVFKNCTSFTDCLSEINNTDIDNTKDIDVVIPMYNSIEYNDNYSKTSGNLWLFYKDEPALTDAGAIKKFPDNSSSFKCKHKITGPTVNDGRKAVKIMVPLKYLSNFWRTLEIPLVNCEIIVTLICSKYCVVLNAAANHDTKFTINDKTLCFGCNFIKIM